MLNLQKRLVNMKFIKLATVICMLALTMMIVPNTSLAYSHTGGLYTEAQFDFVKSKVLANAQPWKAGYDKLVADANAWASETPSAVAVWSVPGYYIDSSGHIAARDIMLNDAKAAYANAMAYKFTGTTSYADTARDIINDWAYTNTSITGYDGRLVAAYIGVGLIMSAELIDSYSGWNTGDKNQFKSWLTSVYVPTATIAANNNRGIWSTFARMSAYHYLDDSSGFASMVTTLKSQINISIAADGHMPEETARDANGLWYTYFALAPMTAASQMVYNVTGENLFTGKLTTALDYLFTYAQAPSTWPWHSPAYFPNPLSSTSWSLNLFEAMGGVYGNSDYTNFVQSYRPINAPFNQGAYHHFAWFYPTLMYNVLSVSPDIVIDNSDSGFAATGAWATSTATAGFYGSNYLHDLTPGADVGKTATWTPTITQAGNYKIYMRWPAYNNRPDAAPLTITYNGGSSIDTSKTVNQTKNSNAWVLVGTYAFTTGTGNSVTISATDSGYTIADAVKFVKQ